MATKYKISNAIRGSFRGTPTTHWELTDDSGRAVGEIGAAYVGRRIVGYEAELYGVERQDFDTLAEAKAWAVQG